MRILTRVEEIRAVEHLRLRQAVMAAGTALEQARAAEVERAEQAAASVRRVDMFGHPLPEPVQVADPVRRPDFEPMIRAWKPVEEAVLDRLDIWEEVLWPLVRRWSDGAPVEEDVMAVAETLSASRAQLSQLLVELRKQVLFLPIVSEPMRAVFAAVERCDRAEVDEVLPALRSGSRDVAEHAERSQSGEDVSRNLRAALKRSEPPPPPVAKDPLTVLLSWVGLVRE